MRWTHSTTQIWSYNTQTKTSSPTATHCIFFYLRFPFPPKTWVATLFHMINKWLTTHSTDTAFIWSVTGLTAHESLENKYSTHSEPQNGWGWKEPLEIIQSNSTAQTGSPKGWPHKGCLGSQLDSFTIYREGGSTCSLSTMCQCSATCKVRRCFLMVRRKLLLQMEPIASHLAVGHHWKEAGTILFAPSLYVFTYMDKSFPEPKFPRLNPSSSISLSSQERCSTLFIIFMALQRTLSSMSMSLLLLGGQNWAQHSRVTSSVL